MILIEQFQAITVSEIMGYIERHQEENIFLEFKTLNRSDLNHADDRKNFAKALSGFANSSGGIIVWGIGASRNSDGIDCASTPALIKNLPLLISRFNQLTGEAVSPFVEGVQHRPIPTDGDRGFAVTVVPESDAGPHMAKLGEDRYFKRSGDSFYKMEHFDLEDMFGRRRKPKIELLVERSGVGSGTSVLLSIVNSGRGTAKYPYLAFNATEPFKPSELGVDGNGNHGLKRLLKGPDLKHRFGSTDDIVIHPGTSHQITRIDLRTYTQCRQPPLENLIINFELSAEGVQMVRGSIDLGLIAPD